MDSIALLSWCAGPTAFFAANLTWMAGIRQFESPGMSRDSPRHGAARRMWGRNGERFRGADVGRGCIPGGVAPPVQGRPTTKRNSLAVSA